MDNLFIDFLNTSITASYIIIAVLLIRFIFKGMPRKFVCALWAIAGLRLILPFSIESSFSLIPSAETLDPVSGSAYGMRLNSGIAPLDISVNDFLVQNEMAATSGALTPSDKNVITSVIAVIWLIGIAAILLFGIISYLKLKKTVSTAVLLDNNIFQCENVVSPFILGIFKPRIYIPFNLNCDTRNYVIAHENAHIKRHDYRIKPLGFLLLAIYWFNPLVWVAYIMLCRDIEIACDEKVIAQMDGDERKEYAAALLDCAVNRRKIAACPLAFGEVGIKERIKGVMNYKKPAFWVIVIAIIACAAAAVCFLTNPKDGSGDDYEYSYRIIAEINYDDSDKVNTQVLRADNGVTQKIMDGVEYTVTNVDLQRGDITLDFGGVNKLFGDAFDIELGGVVINLNNSLTVKAEDGAEITLRFAQTQTLENAISKAIMEYNKGRYLEGTAAFESHETLKVERDGGFTGSDDAEDVTAYLVMAYGEYVFNNGEVEDVSGCVTPIVLHFKYIEGIYTLTEYWQPEDGNRYVDSIRDKFPLIEAEIAMHKVGNGELTKANKEKAKIYFEGLDNNLSVKTNCEAFSASVINLVTEGENPHIEVSWSNSTAYDIECTDAQDLQIYDNYSWLYCKKLRRPEVNSTHDLIKSGRVAVKRYELNAFDMSADGLYRFSDTFKIRGEEFTSYIDFAKGTLITEPEREEVFTTVTQIAPQFDTSAYYSVLAVAKNRFVGRKLIDGSPYSSLLNEEGGEILAPFRGEIRRINEWGGVDPVLSVEPYGKKKILTDADGKKLTDYEFNLTGNLDGQIYGVTEDEYVFFDINGYFMVAIKEGETADLRPRGVYTETVKHCGNCFKYGLRDENGRQIVPCEYDMVDVVSRKRIIARIGEPQGLSEEDIFRIFDGTGKQLTKDGDYSSASFPSWDDDFGIASKFELVGDDYKVTSWIIDKDGTKHSDGYDSITYEYDGGFICEKDGVKTKIYP